RYERFDEENVRAIFTELEFRTLASRIFKEPSAKKPSINAPAQMDLFGAPSAPVVTIVHESEESDSATTLEVGPPPVLDTIWANVHNYHKIKGQEKVQELVDFLQLQTEVCFDTETTDLDPMKAELVGLSFSYITGEAFYIPVTPDQQETQAVLEILRPFFENEAILKIGQNVKYDILVLKNYGIEVKGKIYDTMLAHYLIDPDGKHGMDWLA